jgi:sulfur carrier protein ThiS adenylyltransferase
MTFKEIKTKLAGCKIGIAGCGGLGSNAAVALVRSGVGSLIIADFDVVQESNLNRQYFFHSQIGQKKCFALRENILAIRPETSVDAHDLKLTEENIPALFSGCDLIIEAFDLAEMKVMLLETLSAHLPNVPVVCGSGLAGFGNNNSIKTSRYHNIYVCGDGITEVSSSNEPLAPKVGIVANMQANVAVELLITGTWKSH